MPRIAALKVHWMKTPNEQFQPYRAPEVIFIVHMRDTAVTTVTIGKELRTIPLPSIFFCALVSTELG